MCIMSESFCGRIMRISHLPNTDLNNAHGQIMGGIFVHVHTKGETCWRNFSGTHKFFRKKRTTNKREKARGVRRPHSSILSPYNNRLHKGKLNQFRFGGEKMVAREPFDKRIIRLSPEIKKVFSRLTSEYPE